MFGCYSQKMERSLLWTFRFVLEFWMGIMVHQWVCTGLYTGIRPMDITV